ncbi:MAG: YceI family protein [Chitinophagaceae bacterium]|nr:YceI family protein [Chitinophagaceae bacterium]
MKRILLSVWMLISAVNTVSAQKYYTKNGNVSFFSKTNMENIKADNNQVMSVLNPQTGELQFSLLVKSFHFPKALMEEHFNENYLESDKFPKSTFKGTINDISKVNFASDGTYPVTVSGELTIHGVTNTATTKGNIIIKGGKITGTAIFIVALADYKVAIPKLVENNISKTIEITVNCLYDQKM